MSFLSEKGAFRFLFIVSKTIVNLNSKVRKQREEDKDTCLIPGWLLKDFLYFLM
jgi:hypothetical protein